MIKFNTYNVRNTESNVKARIHYSLDNHVSRKPVVTLYAKDYSGDLGKVFAAEYVNDTDSQTDYFDKGRVRLFENHPLYKAARAVAEAAKAKQDARYAARREARAAGVRS